LKNKATEIVDNLYNDSIEINPEEAQVRPLAVCRRPAGVSLFPSQ